MEGQGLNHLVPPQVKDEDVCQHLDHCGYVYPNDSSWLTFRLPYDMVKGTAHSIFCKGKRCADEGFFDDAQFIFDNKPLDTSSDIFPEYKSAYAFKRKWDLSTWNLGSCI